MSIKLHKGYIGYIKTIEHSKIQATNAQKPIQLPIPAPIPIGSLVL